MDLVDRAAEGFRGVAGPRTAGRCDLRPHHPAGIERYPAKPQGEQGGSDEVAQPKRRVVPMPQRRFSPFRPFTPAALTTPGLS
jgi:hypothetical protein